MRVTGVGLAVLRLCSATLLLGFGGAALAAPESPAKKPNILVVMGDDIGWFNPSFIDRQHEAGKPFFCYFNSTRMHVFTHLKPESQGKTGRGLYPDGMVEHDGHVGQLLKKLDDLGIADDTIVVYTTDNGAEVMSWPDGRRKA